MSPSSKDQATPPPPGAPAAEPVSLEEPTTPHEPLPPKPEQQSPATVSPTGADLGARPHRHGPAGRLPHDVHRRAAARHGPLAARRVARADPARRTTTCARRSPTSTTSASPSGSCTPAAPARTAPSSATAPRSDLTLGRVPREGRRDTGVRAVLDRRRVARLGRHGARHPRVRDEVLHRARATSTWSATTSRSSSSRTASSSPTSSTR